MIRFKEYRLLANMTQQQLADKINCSRTHVSEVEAGIKDPSIKLLLHAAFILSTCPCLLLGFEHENCINRCDRI